MFEDRKIRKALREEMGPSKSFEQFCQENGLALTPAPKPKQKKTAARLKWILPTVSAVVVALVCCIVLPMVISPVKEYAFDEVERVKISKEEFVQTETAAFLSLDNAEANDCNKIFSKDKKKRFLAYELKGLIGESYDITILVRVYRGYLFSSYRYFEELAYDMQENDITVSYAIKEQTAYIKFKVDKTEYFISLSGRNNTEINEESVENFIRDIII